MVRWRMLPLATASPVAADGGDLMLPTEDDLWACAEEMIRVHGEDAAIVAAQRADEALDAIELDKAHFWRIIVRRINELQARRSGSLH
jgi:hypothetical protein